MMEASGDQLLMDGGLQVSSKDTHQAFKNEEPSASKDSCASMADATDSSLIRSIRDGDDVAARDLFERYIAKLKNLAGKQLARELSGRLDSEDITQSVFRTFFRRIGEGQYQVPEGETIWKLLAVITLNKIRTMGTHHRAGKRDIRKTTGVELQALGNEVATSEDALRVLHLTIQDLVGGLPEIQQRMVQLRLEEHDIASIAAKVGRSKRTVERVLQGFRADLKRAIQDTPES